MLAGEPGIGKTSLADRAAALAARARLHGAVGAVLGGGRGARVLAVARSDRGAVARARRGGAGARRSATARRCWARSFPSCARGSPSTPAGAAPPVEEGRFRLWRAVSALVHEATKAKPALLVLDDLHAADQSSLSLLHFVARQLRPMRVLLLASYRDVEARMDAATGELLSRVGREGTTLSLARLDRAAASRFVQERVGSVSLGRRGARASIAARATRFFSRR